MFLYKFFEQVAQDAGIDYFSVNHQVPNQDLVTPEITVSFCICPVRYFEPAHFDQLHRIERVTQIFHVRDPRDIIVSEYYSLGWIHPIDKGNDAGERRRQEIQKMSVDDYVLNQPEFSSNPLEKKFAPLLDRFDKIENAIFVKYETMVGNFPSWVSSVIPPFGFRWPKLQVARYAWQYRHEFKTTGENLTHKRRITPGDHREKLQPSTIKKLNERYSPILEKFGYSP